MAVEMCFLGKGFRCLVLFLFILQLFTPIFSIKRKLNLQEYLCPPKIQECKDKNISLVYVSAESADHDNVVHFVWSGFQGPSIINAYSEKLPEKHAKPGLNVKWENLFKNDTEGALEFTPKVDYITAFSLSSVLQFADPKDEIYFTKTGGVIEHNLRSVQWRKVILDKDNDNATFVGEFLGGTISFSCAAADHDDRDEEPPRPRYSSNSTRFTVNLSHLKTNSTDRLALEFVSVVKSEESMPSCSREFQSIDDEHSPGIFRTVVINNTYATYSSFISWKPVMYTKLDRGLKTQLPAFNYLYKNGKFEQTKISSKHCFHLTERKTLLPKIILGAMSKDIITYPIRLSSGQKKDGWYKATQLLSWSGQAGCGQPLFDSISKTLYITIIAGLGIPALIILGGFYCLAADLRKSLRATCKCKLVKVQRDV
ncbi:predicted protein [Nematostella vectensis]|uniref:Uncharacterized protein n=1 Tax=Nematostella vectensis TaxID=45351 RepID=A7SF52_NEMVE|nr:predicted protein [Nematostella vectensis]|eukprot:XP_001629687.1 predicted protein [Nematostella vectensis]